MDTFAHLLSLTPVPYLRTAFDVFRYIVRTIEQVQASKHQLQALALSIAELLGALDAEYREGRLSENASYTDTLDKLQKLLDEIAAFIQKYAECSFLKLMFKKDQVVMIVQSYHQRIAALVHAFQISALVSIQHWQQRNGDAKVKDQMNLDSRLNDLELNQSKLTELLDAQHNSVNAMMVSLQRQLQQTSIGEQERRFFSHTLRYLSISSGCQVELQSWMITPYEVDFGPVIGAGGFGKVYKGTWNKLEVALKVFKTEDGIVPSSEAIRNEIETWSKILHPNVLQFMGANILDNQPFVVMPYMKNGDARHYLQRHPTANRLKMIHGISLGILHLHSLNVVHGDIKAANVLVDDGGNAVLCDFGLSRVKADQSTRTANAGFATVTGTRNWMAPERLTGASLRKPSDIYSFAVTIFEIYTNETPFAEMNYSDFVELVARQDVRPERPEEDEAPQLSDEVWELAENCWVKDPRKRPKAGDICDTISRLLGAGIALQSTSTLTRDECASPLVAASPIESALPPMAEATSSPPTPSTSVTLVDSEQTPIADRTLSGRNKPLPPIIRPPASNQSLDHNVGVTAVGTQSSTSPVDYSRRKLYFASQGTFDRLSGHTKDVWCVAFSPDGECIVSCAHDRTIRIWNTSTCEMAVGPMKGSTGSFFSVAFSPTGGRIVSGSDSFHVRVWDAQTGDRLLGPLRGHTGKVRSVSFSPDGRWIASGSFDNTIRIWEADTGAISNTITGHNDWVNSIAFSPDGKWLVSGSDDKTIRIWNPHTGHGMSEPLRGHTGRVYSVAFSADGQRIVSGSKDMTIRIWDVDFTNNESTAPRRVVSQCFEGHTDRVSSVAFSPDGQWIASGSYDGTVIFWDAKTGRKIGQLQGDGYSVHTIAFSPDGKRIVSGCDNGTLYMWRVAFRWI